MSVELELNQLKTRVKQLETVVQQLAAEKNVIPSSLPEAPETQDLLPWLETQGLLASLPAEAKHRAQRWRQLREAEQEAHFNTMRQIRFDPPLSQIVQENRR